MKHTFIIVLVVLVGIGLSEAFWGRGGGSRSGSSEDSRGRSNEGSQSDSSEGSQSDSSEESRSGSREGGKSGRRFRFGQWGRKGSHEGGRSHDDRHDRNRVNPCRLSALNGTVLDQMNCTANATCTGESVLVNNTAVMFNVTFCTRPPRPTTPPPPMDNDDDDDDDDDMSHSMSMEDEMRSPISMFLASIDNKCAPMEDMEQDDDDMMSSSEEDMERAACPRNTTCSGTLSNSYDDQMLSICVPNNRPLNFTFLLRCHKEKRDDDPMWGEMGEFMRRLFRLLGIPHPNDHSGERGSDGCM